MAKVSLWGQIHQIAPRRFAVVVTAMPVNAHDRQPVVVLQLARDLVEARQVRNSLLVKVGRGARRRGDAIVDVIEE